jgi:preprotein translocase subunit SecA
METLKIPEDQPIESRIVSKAIDEAQAKVEGLNFDLRKHLLEYDSVLNLHRERVYGERRKILEAEPSQLREKILEILEGQGCKREDFEKKEEEIGKERILEIAKYLYLQILDSLWVNHLENMEYLRDSVSLRAYGQREPLVEYKKEGNRIFKDFFENLNSTFAKIILGLKLEEREIGEIKVSSRKPGRNEPCPCGSGKKYKKCCWPKYG